MKTSTDVAQNAGPRLEVILALVQAGDGDAALTEIRDMVAALRANAPEEQEATDDNAPPAWRVIAAHLRAAEVEIEQTRLAPAEDSIAKAIYASTHPVSQAADAQLNV